MAYDIGVCVFARGDEAIPCRLSVLTRTTRLIKDSLHLLEIVRRGPPNHGWGGSLVLVAGVVASIAIMPRLVSSPFFLTASMSSITYKVPVGKTTIAEAIPWALAPTARRIAPRRAEDDNHSGAMFPFWYQKDQKTLRQNEFDRKEQKRKASI